MTMLKTLLSRLGLNRSASAMSDQIKTVDAATVMGWLKDGSAVIVDVREPQEHRAGHIPGATLVPLSQFDPARVLDATGKHLVFHCQSGRRCGPASAKMVTGGYTGDIYRLSGGMAAWMAAGGPVER
ncbi:rhodanese-like domain-containing protein (plasmid) [Azospirillum argentinense]|uniref:Rhodanese-like domain-containing protein n=2 Tax=Azospirillum argentinense TaxID=2970906 RepID=A0A4D8PLZ0_9PROT|nr:rhodanese-like domain-containing protein [Azospirillum argentinense]